MDGIESVENGRVISPQKKLYLEGRDLVEKGWYGKKLRNRKRAKTKTN